MVSPLRLGYYFPLPKPGKYTLKLVLVGKPVGSTLAEGDADRTAGAADAEQRIGQVIVKTRIVVQGGPGGMVMIPDEVDQQDGGPQDALPLVGTFESNPVTFEITP
jgi:hypothetical protein